MKLINPKHIFFFIVTIVAIWLPIWAIPKISNWFPALNQEQLDFVKAVVATTPALLLFVGNVVYNHSERVYFWANRTVLWFANKSVSWTMFVELEQKNPGGVLERIKANIIEKYPETRVWSDDKFKKTFKVPYPIAANILVREINLGDESDYETTQIVIEVSDFVVPFRHSLKSIRDMASLINKCVVSSTENSTAGKFTFKINFEENNPYFGLFVRQLRVPEKQLVHFECVFNDEIGQASGLVQVSSDKLSLTTDSLANLQILSQRYITLATLDLTGS